MIINQVIKSKPNTNLEKLTKSPEQGVFKKIFSVETLKRMNLFLIFSKNNN